MAFNIVSAVARYLTPDVIGKIATASGLDSSTAQKAVGAAVPAILSALVGAVSRPGGAEKVANTVAEQSGDVLTNLAGKLTGSPQIASKGSSLLSSLLGGGVSSMLASTVGRFLGIGGEASQTLMGLLTPLIMGVIGREQQTNSLDAGGLARMLMGQKDVIADAMPSGLASLLADSGVGRTGREDTTRVQYDPPRGPSPPPVSPATTKSTHWAYWVIPLLLIGGLLWAFLPREHEATPVRTSQPAPEPSRTVASAEQQPAYLSGVSRDWVSIGSAPNDYVSRDIFNKANERIGTIKDVLVAPDGKMAAAIVTVGRYLGIGDKDVAVPFSALRLEQQADTRRIVMDTTKDALQAAPTFEPARKL